MTSRKPTVEEFLASLVHARSSDIHGLRAALLASDPILASLSNGTPEFRS
ncbi:MAG: hypothetical protein R2706_11480 [Acidimicrobiales bacterium]